ncbi:MAG TPA: EF-hand domain-containing protein [Planctomycetota bacterium]|nr:EF-hand domain-containing protein [Planctomycetota bacterium]
MKSIGAALIVLLALGYSAGACECDKAAKQGGKQSKAEGQRQTNKKSMEQRKEAMRGDEGAMGKREELFKRFDKNGDGNLDDDEKAAAKEAMKDHWRANHEEMLKRFDTDGDGKLSPEEKEAAREKMQSIKERHEKK